MILKLKIFSIVIAVSIFVVILELIRRRKLKEDLSFIWIVSGIIILITALFEDIVFFIADLTGVTTPQSMLFFFGLIFLILLNLQLSIKISGITDQLKNLIQKNTMLEYEVEVLRRRIKKDRGKKVKEKEHKK